MTRTASYILAAVAGALLVAALMYGCNRDTTDTDALRQERNTALARADSAQAAAAASAEQARAWQASADEWADTVHDLLASRERAQVSEEIARAQRDRLASDLRALERESAQLREASNANPDDAPLARQALAACSTSLDACGDLRAAQDTVIARQDSIINRGDRAIIALTAQAAASDSAATGYRSAYEGLLDGYAAQGDALRLYDQENRAHRRTITALRIQRGAIIAAAVAGGAYLLTR